MAEEDLDVGVSLQLRILARDQRSESQAIAWMASVPVQEFLEQISHELFLHSLEVERRAAQVKQWEGSKVTHIATASCNNICVRFAKERDAKALAIEEAIEKLRKAKYMNKTSLAMKNGDTCITGARFQTGTDFNLRPQTHPLGSGRGRKTSAENKE